MKIVLLLLGASVVANAYLILSSGPDHGSAVVFTDGKAEPPHPRPRRSTPDPDRGSVPGIPAQRPVSGPADCADKVAATERAVAELRAELLATLPARKAFEIGEPNSIAQERVSALVERVLTGVAPSRLHAVECRATICRVAVLEPATAIPAEANTWMRALREDPELIRLRSDGLSFERRRWVRDEGSGMFFRQIPVYIRLRSTP